MKQAFIVAILAIYSLVFLAAAEVVAKARRKITGRSTAV